MHWLKKFRMEYVRKDGKVGISREVFASKVRRRGVGCSEKLIAIIEEGGITHPRIAKKIAIVAEATKEQYESMIHEERRNGWAPPKPARRSEHKKLPPPLAPEVIPDHAKRVVAVDISGKEIARFESVTAAAEAVGCTPATVSNRCNRNVSSGTGEFRFFDCTWRFANEWDAMSDFEREADIENARKIKKERKKKCETA